jgi:hypothetical protein
LFCKAPRASTHGAFFSIEIVSIEIDYGDKKKDYIDIEHAEGAQEML